MFRFIYVYFFFFGGGGRGVMYKQLSPISPTWRTGCPLGNQNTSTPGGPQKAQRRRWKIQGEPGLCLWVRWGKSQQRLVKMADLSLKAFFQYVRCIYFVYIYIYIYITNICMDILKRKHNIDISYAVAFRVW